MHRPLFPLTPMALALTLWASSDLMAQMFGRPPSIGGITQGTSSSGGSASALNPGGVGVLQGNERFLRDRRDSSFIGGDLRDRRRFIGSRQGMGTTGRPALSSVRIETAPAVNRPLPPSAQRRTGMYDPPLEIGFDYRGPERQDVNVALARRLQDSPALHPASRIEVSLEGTTATLRGEVASERDRVLAEQLALFEPGIYAVRNDLRVMKRPARADGWRASPPKAAPSAGVSPH